jgi:hypothetical protein
MQITQKILDAARKTQKTIMLHGESGRGKTSMIKQYAKERNLLVVMQPSPTLDPQSLSHPRVVEGVLENLIAKWFADLTLPCPEGYSGRVLFIDEFNRPFHPLTMAMMTQILTERALYGRKLAEDVFIVGTCNLEEEDDSGIEDIPQAVKKRAGHFYWNPDEASTLAGYRNNTAKQIAMHSGKIIFANAQIEGGVPRIIADMKPCNRQADAVGDMIETGLLSQAEIRSCYIAFLGLEAGSVMANAYEDWASSLKSPLSRPIQPESFDALDELQRDKGQIVELSQYLRDQFNARKTSQALVVRFLLERGLPEVVNSLRDLSMEISVSSFKLTLQEQDKAILDNLKEKIGKRNLSWLQVAFALKRLSI